MTRNALIFVLTCFVAGTHLSASSASKRYINDSRAVSVTVKSFAPNFEKLADAIYRHEGGIRTKYPYGCHKPVNGKLRGWPEAQARQVCIGICRRVYAERTTWTEREYFVALNNVYAQDKHWRVDVERIYGK